MRFRIAASSVARPSWPCVSWASCPRSKGGTPSALPARAGRPRHGAGPEAAGGPRRPPRGPRPRPACRPYSAARASNCGSLKTASTEGTLRISCWICASMIPVPKPHPVASGRHLRHAGLLFHCFLPHGLPLAIRIVLARNGQTSRFPHRCHLPVDNPPGGAVQRSDTVRE